MCWWIYSCVMLSITSKIFSSLQDRKLEERGENNICPAKQNLEQEEIVYRESTNVYKDHL